MTFTPTTRTIHLPRAPHARCYGCGQWLQTAGPITEIDSGSFVTWYHPPCVPLDLVRPHVEAL